MTIGINILKTIFKKKLCIMVLNKYDRQLNASLKFYMSQTLD